MVADNWVSNKNWSQLALAYGLHDYVKWKPYSWPDCLIALDVPQPIKVPNRTKQADQVDGKTGLSGGQLRYWGDLWEGWWGAIFYERHLWGETTDDIDDMLRFWIRKKYQTLIQEFSTTSRIPISPSHYSVYTKNDVDTEAITRKHKLLCDILGTPEKDNSKDVLGIKASVHDLNINVFYPLKRKQEVIENVLRLANKGIKEAGGCYVAAGRPQEEEDLARTFTRKREEGPVRQLIWDILATELLNSNPSRGLSAEALEQVYTRIRRLEAKILPPKHESRGDILNNPFRSRMKSFALLFWAEVNTSFFASLFFSI